MRTRFQQFILDSDTRQLQHDGADIHLSTKAFDLLRLLLARRPNVIAKDELLRQIWPQSFVTEANLNVLVGEIRRALGDNAQTAQFIRTVHGVGYAFCGTATDVAGGPEPEREDRPPCRLVGNNRAFALTEGDNIIGRDPSCNIWLDDPDVSRRHARIRIDSVHRTALLDDLNSTNGTLLGRLRIKSETAITDGDVIRVGPVQLTFRNASDSSQQTRRIRRKTR